MRERGHHLCITARAKDQSLELLDQFGLAYRHISSQPDGRAAAVEMAQRTGCLLKVMPEFRPDVMSGIMGPSIAVAGDVRTVPAVAFTSELAVQTNRFGYPLDPDQRGVGSGFRGSVTSCYT